jgi:hypothetical protein
MKGASRQCLHRPSSPPARTWQAIRYHDTRRHQQHNSLARFGMNRALQRCRWWYPCTTTHAPSHRYKTLAHKAASACVHYRPIGGHSHFVFGSRQCMADCLGPCSMIKKSKRWGSTSGEGVSLRGITHIAIYAAPDAHDERLGKVKNGCRRGGLHRPITRSLSLERDQKNIIQDRHRAWAACSSASGNVIHSGGRG